MSTLGIIAEYNPFHNGHLFHLERSKITCGCEHAVAVMSGDFVQRGEPAILDKFVRAEIAVECGVDLVLELPVWYSTASAEFFADGAIELLANSGIVDCLCFGSESGELAPPVQIANLLADEPQIYKAALKENLSGGLSFARARQAALAEVGVPDASLIESPNNILAVEYLKALKRRGSDITPATVKREGAGYHDENLQSAISSATAVRSALARGELDAIRRAVPPATYDKLSELSGRLPDIDRLSGALQYIIKFRGADYLKTISGVTEGLENRIVRAANEAYSFTEILKLLKTKRYPTSTLRRALLNILLDITDEAFAAFRKDGADYIRVLAFHKEKSFLVRRLKENSKLPVIVNRRDEKKIAQKEKSAENVYRLL